MDLGPGSQWTQMGQDPGATTSNGPGAGLNGLQWLLIGGTRLVFFLARRRQFRTNPGLGI